MRKKPKARLRRRCKNTLSADVRPRFCGGCRSSCLPFQPRLGRSAPSTRCDPTGFSARIRRISPHRNVCKSRGRQYWNVGSISLAECCVRDEALQRFQWVVWVSPADRETLALINRPEFCRVHTNRHRTWSCRWRLPILWNRKYTPGSASLM